MEKRGAEHTRVQRLARERDDYTCQICGSKLHAAGHHIMDYQYGGSAEEDNIITLCRSCHNKVHKGFMDIFVFK